MSTIPEHIAFLRQLRKEAKDAQDAPIGNHAQRLYQSQAYLLVEAHLEEIAALVKAIEWQPRETAPRDGRHILVTDLSNQSGFGMFDGVRMPWSAVVHFFAPNPDEAGFYLSSGAGDTDAMDFTHWREIGATYPNANHQESVS